jgi:hypothetical protein
LLTADDEDALVSEIQAHLVKAHPGGHSPSREQVFSVLRARNANES